jgi:hypothetical protein
MSRIDRLAHIFGKHIAVGWPASSSGAQRVIMIVYDPADERLLRRKLDLFAQGALGTNKAWTKLDLTAFPAKWLREQRYRDIYFEEPEEFQSVSEERVASAAAVEIEVGLRDSNHGPESIFAIYGVGSLYGFASVSDVLSRVEHLIKGRLVVFFPGQYRDARYRLLDARESWDYHAVPILHDDSGELA